MTSDRTNQTITLKDGYTLGYAEYGDIPAWRRPLLYPPALGPDPGTAGGVIIGHFGFGADAGFESTFKGDR